MTLFHLLAAAAAVAAWFVALGWGTARAGVGTGPLRPVVDVVESVFLTMFAALWFGSLGHGGWWVLFIVLGLLIEGPVRTRHRGALDEGAPWLPVVLGVVRIVGAGALLAFLL